MPQHELETETRQRGESLLDAAAIGVFAWGFGFQTWERYQARKIGESQPCLKLPLRDLPNEAADAAPGTKETLFGYEFEVPWPNVDAKVFRQQAMLTAPNGLALIFWDPADRQQLLDDSRNPVQHPNMKEHSVRSWEKRRRSPTTTF